MTNSLFVQRIVLQGDLLYADGLMQEQLGLLAKFVGALGGKVVDGAAFGAALFHVGMTLEIVPCALGNILALGYDTDAAGDVLLNLWQQEGVVGAAQDDGVYLGVETQQLVNVLLDEIVGTGRAGLVVFNQWHPKGAGHPRDADVGMQFLNLQTVTVAPDGAFCGKDAHMAAAGERADDLGGGADDPQHAALGVKGRQVVLLNGAQSLGRSGVAAQDDQMAPHLEEAHDGLAREFVDDLEGTCAVGCTGIVAQIEVVVFGQQLADAMQDGESAVTTVENADGPRPLR